MALSDLRSIAQQMRELGNEPRGIVALGTAGRLLEEVFRLGAFSGADFVQLRHIFEPSFWTDGRVLLDMAFECAVDWLSTRNMGVVFSSDWPGRGFCGAPAVWKQTNLPAVATLIEQQAALIDQQTAGGPEVVGKRNKVSRKEANIRAREALKNPKTRSVRKLAQAIGCSPALAGETDAWKAYQEAKKKPRAPKAVGLTDAIEAGMGQPDGELNQLIAEQTADFEESPLVSRVSKHHPRRRKV